MANRGTQEAVEPFTAVVMARDIGREVGGEVIQWQNLKVPLMIVRWNKNNNQVYYYGGKRVSRYKLVCSESGDLPTIL